MLPKVKGANVVNQFRPTALSNFFFKIIPKIVSTRLSSLMGKLVLPNHCDFVKGRHISSYITAVSECVNLLNNISFEGNMGMVIDFAKAFNTI